MIKKIVEISKEPTCLSVKLGQLIIRQSNNTSQIPCEDIGILLLDHPAITYTQHVLTALMENNSTLIVCNDKHLPAGLFLPLEASQTQTQSYSFQIQAKTTLKKRLWQQIIKAKIDHQAYNVKDNHKASRALKRLSMMVKSGDPENIEARASKLYWKYYLADQKFTRDRFGPAPNNLLNYGYMVLRAAIARSLCSSGLLPSVGLHHHNKYNAFCLADDLIEPFRGFVESKVRSIWKSKDPASIEKFDQTIKAMLLEVLYEEINLAGFKGPLTVALHRTTASLEKCYKGEQNHLLLPEL